MKNTWLRRVLLLAAGVGAMAGSAEAAAADGGFLVVCRGGPVGLGYLSGHDKKFEFRFTRSAFSGVSGKLKPGECAFLDRPLKQDEPATFVVTNNLMVSIRWDASTKSVSAASVNFWGDFGNPTPQEKMLAEYVATIADSTKTFYFRIGTKIPYNWWMVNKVGP